MAKDRDWEFHLTVACSGPDSASFAEVRSAQGGMQPRLYGNLRYARADCDFFFDLWKIDGALEASTKEHRALDDPTKEELIEGLSDAADWLCDQQTQAGNHWDGGSLTFVFCGHGRDDDGALVLKDGHFPAEEFADVLRDISRRASPGGNLRLNLVLDSCHSGGFLLRSLVAFDDPDSGVFPYNMLASSMSDEASWEDPALGHGIFTYSFSVNVGTINNSVGATAVQPDNSLGPSVSILEGGGGSSLLTLGRQNPIQFMGDGVGSLIVCGQRFDVRPGYDESCYSVPEFEERLKQHRDPFREIARQFARATGRFDGHEGGWSDAEIRAMTQERLVLLGRANEIAGDRPGDDLNT